MSILHMPRPGRKSAQNGKYQGVNYVTFFFKVLFCLERSEKWILELIAAICPLQFELVHRHQRLDIEQQIDAINSSMGLRIYSH